MDRKKIIIGAVAAALLIVVAALAMTPKSGPLPASGDVTNAQLKDLIAQGVRLVDVRTAAEYEGGHISGAENVPIDTLPAAAGGWDKSQAIALYCATGARSANAFGYLQGQGFTHVYNLTNGVASWDGELVNGAASGSAAAFPATTLPTMYDFSTST